MQPSASSGFSDWSVSTNDPTALESAANPDNLSPDAGTPLISFTIDINLTDGQVHPVAIYGWIGGNDGRTEQTT